MNPKENNGNTQVNSEKGALNGRVEKLKGLGNTMGVKLKRQRRNKPI